MAENSNFPNGARTGKPPALTVGPTVAKQNIAYRAISGVAGWFKSFIERQPIPPDPTTAMQETFKRQPRPDTRYVASPRHERVSVAWHAGPAQVAETMAGALLNNSWSFGNLCAIFDRYLLSDLKLRAIYEKRRRKVRRFPYTVQYPDETLEPRADDIGKYAESIIAGIPRFERNVLWELTDAIGKGIAFVELDGHFDEDGKIKIVNARGIPQYAMRNPPDPGNLIWGYDPYQWEFWSVIGWVPVPTGKMLVYPINEQGHYMTAGLMWPCIWHMLLKNFSMKEWIEFLEIYGMPFRKGVVPAEYKPGSPEWETVALAVLESASNAGCVISDEMNVEFVNGLAGANSDAFHKFVTYIDESLAELFLGGTLTSNAGNKGARSLGDVHSEEEFQIVADDASDLAEFLSDELIKPLVIQQFGPCGDYPKFTFDLSFPKDQVAESSVVFGMIDRGVPLVKSYIYETLAPGGEPGEDDDVFLNPKAPSVPLPPAPELLADEGRGGHIAMGRAASPLHDPSHPLHRFYQLLETFADDSPLAAARGVQEGHGKTPVELLPPYDFPTWDVEVKMPHDRQVWDDDCVVIVALTGAQFWGVNAREDYLAKRFELSKKKAVGVDPADVVKWWRSLGLLVEETFDATFEQIEARLRQGLPTFIIIQAYPKDPAKDLATATDEGHGVWVNALNAELVGMTDPVSPNLTTLTRKQFEERRHDANGKNYAAWIVGPGKPKYKPDGTFSMDAEELATPVRVSA